MTEGQIENAGQLICERQPSNPDPPKKGRLIKKTVVMYLTMVAVSTVAIFWLEHATVFNALRTALVAAVGKTIAANMVSGFFE